MKDAERNMPNPREEDTSDAEPHSTSYYYDDATGYEIYRGDDDEEECDGMLSPEAADEPDV